MPLDLHASARARITELVSRAIPLLDVENGKFVKRASEGIVFLFMADQALPQRGPLHETMLAYVDEYPLVEFVVDTLAAELRDAEYETEPAQKKLAMVSGYEDADQVAKRLVEQFTALPNQYRMTFPLPSGLWSCLPAAESKWTLEINSSRLIRTSDDLSDLLPLSTPGEDTNRAFSRGLLSSFFETGPLKWDEGAVHLQVDVEGFVGPYGGSVPDLEWRRFIRSFCGLGLALQLFKTKPNHPLHPPRHRYFVHRKDSDGHWQIQSRLELDDSVSRGLERLQLSDLMDTPEKQAHWCPRILAEMAHVISAGRRAEPIMLASQWFFDSATGADRLLPFIQAMVVLEILLGDKAASKEIGLNELLRNRCAYLIGSGQEEREELYKTFSDIYDVRSQIVHRGKHRLNAHEVSLLGRLRVMCRRVIQKEVDLLVADKKRKEGAASSSS